MSKHIEKEDSRGSLGKEEERRGGDPRDLALFLPHACRQLQADFAVTVTTHFQDEIFGTEKRRRSTNLPAIPSAPAQGSRSGSAPSRTGGSCPSDEAITLAAVHDSAGALVELNMHHVALPCMLLKLLAMSASYQTRLTRLTLRSCRLDARALHQLCELLPASNITELCLDDSPVRAGGYHLLFQHPSNLAYLSLDRCSLGYDGVVAIAEHLHYPRHAASTLRVLSLATNSIGDEGARALGAALRSNRGLQHLNLADNRISDAGAAHIFDSLAEFELTDEEMLATQRRLLDRLRRRQSVFARVLAELQAASVFSLARRGRRNTVAVPSSGVVGEALAARAGAATDELMGPSAEPYSADHTRRIINKHYCKGNTTLRWLDFAYNGLGQASLESLRRVLCYQASQRPSRAGVIRAVLDGDPLPASEELHLVAGLLEEARARAAHAHHPLRDRRSLVVGRSRK